MRRNEWSLSYTSAFFDLSTPGILFQWQKLYAREGTNRLKPQTKGRPRVTNHSSTPKPSSEMTEKELREELDYLRAENAVLKKLEALAQARKKKAKTKR
jgi:transposase